MYTLYVGTYTQKLPYVDGKGEGIYMLEMHPDSGELNTLRLAAPSTNPSFLAMDALHQRLFAVNELEHWRGCPSGAVSAYAIQPDSTLRLLNQRLSGGAAPCYICAEEGGQGVLIANYVSGTVARLHLNSQGKLRPLGSLHTHQGHGPDPIRQEAPHAHSIAVDPSGRWALAADLGNDLLYIYRLAKFRLLPHHTVSLHPGAGPRHFVFSTDGRRVYLANELDSTLSFFTFDPVEAVLEHVQTLSALPTELSLTPALTTTERGIERSTPSDYGNGYTKFAAIHKPEANTLADIHLHPSGRWLYASNRGHDSIATFKVSPDGHLSLAGNQSSLGRIPRNFAITPDGRFLIVANQDTSNLIVFRVDPKTGLPTPTEIHIEVPTPVSVVLR